MIKNTVPWTYANGKAIPRTFDENELQKKNQKKFRIEQAIKKKGDKWKSYDNLLNS